MEKKDIEELRQKVCCGALLEKAGWEVDRKESTRRAVKYRHGENKIIIVIHEGRGWFDPLSPKKGDVFDLAEHLGADGFTDALARVADHVGFVPTMPAWKPPARSGAVPSLIDRWNARSAPHPRSATWRYLARARAFPDHVIADAVAQDLLREGPQGSMWAAHSNAAGRIIGWEERGPHWRGFATGGTKELFRLGPLRSDRICITEAAIDAMSLAVIEVLRPDTLYVSTGGGWAPATDSAIREIAARTGALLVAATDNNRQGEVYADRVRAIAAETSAPYARARPRAGDWNEDLKNLVGRLEKEFSAAE